MISFVQLGFLALLPRLIHRVGVPARAALNMLEPAFSAETAVPVVNVSVELQALLADPLHPPTTALSIQEGPGPGAGRSGHCAEEWSIDWHRAHQFSTVRDWPVKHCAYKLGLARPKTTCRDPRWSLVFDARL